jgi:hypothetical protein
MGDDYEEPSKNHQATILLYNDTQVVETVDVEDSNYKAVSKINETLSTRYIMIKLFNLYLNIQVTQYILDGITSTLRGFIDPRRNKTYLCSDADYYVRQNIVSQLFNKHPCDELHWKIKVMLKSLF